VEGAPLNNGKLNLLEFGPLKRLLKTGIYPGLFKALNLFLFVFVLYFLLTRPGPIENNWGLKLLWIVWWPLLVPLTFLFARFWCGICPVRFAVSSTGARKPGHGVYAWFKDRGPYISVMLFATITGVDQFYPFAVDPIASAVLLLSVLALFLFFEKVMGGDAQGLLRVVAPGGEGRRQDLRGKMRERELRYQDEEAGGLREPGGTEIQLHVRPVHGVREGVPARVDKAQPQAGF
jgi:hypothetical protein